jgi:hypothetical protein
MIKLTEEDTAELLRLYKQANNAPLIRFRSDLPGPSELAHKALDDFMKAMATKYGYDYTKNAISAKGEVVPI